MLEQSDRSMKPDDTSIAEPGTLKTTRLTGEEILAEEQGAELPRQSGAYRALESLRAYVSELTPVRLASHLAVILVVALVLILGRITMPRWEMAEEQPPEAPTAVVVEENLPLISYGLNLGGAGLGAGDALPRSAVPFTTIPDRPRLGVISYTVQAGDTLSGIAQNFGLGLNTVMWASGLELCPQLLRVGQQVLILPVDGVHHTVEEGDTLEAIAAKYRVTTDAIVGWEENGLRDGLSPLVTGQVLIIPGGIKEAISTGIAIHGGDSSEPSRRGSGRFAWPVRGSINLLDWFGTTSLGGRAGAAPRPWPHKGIDLTAWTGAPILAADSGTVVVAQVGGYNGGYGNYVVIDHGNGFSSLYAHLSTVAVSGGQVVAKGERVGASGSTGMTTGPHLHFEIRYDGVQRNPLCFLSLAG